MERIKLLTNDTNTYGTFGQKREIELPTVRGSLKIYVEERRDNSKFTQIDFSIYTHNIFICPSHFIRAGFFIQVN